MKPRAWNSTLPAPSKPLTRKAALRSGSHLSRSEIRREAEMPKRNAKRAAKRKAEGKVYGWYHALIKTLRCILASDPRHTCIGPVEGAHLIGVGAGGEDAGNEIPLCLAAHRGDGASLHRMGRRSFERHWRVDLAAIAAELWERYGGEG